MGRLLWTPIDVPPFPDICGLLEPSRLDEGFAFWKFLRLTEKKATPYQISDWKPEIAEGFPQLLRWFDHLPFLNLRNIKLNLQIRPVTGHIDFTKPDDDPALWANNHGNEPCGYRILVKGNREDCLWVKKSSGARVMCRMPSDTDVYVLDHTAGFHGVNADSDRWLIFCHAEIDTTRHSEILAKSLGKHGNHAIWDD
jgi:hypothetical protein